MALLLGTSKVFPSNQLLQHRRKVPVVFALGQPHSCFPSSSLYCGTSPWTSPRIPLGKQDEKQPPAHPATAVEKPDVQAAQGWPCLSLGRW